MDSAKLKFIKGKNNIYSKDKRTAIFIHGLKVKNLAKTKKKLAQYLTKKYDCVAFFIYDSNKEFGKNSSIKFSSIINKLKPLSDIDIYGHSKGGLVAKYSVNYLLEKEVLNKIKNVVQVGTPNNGVTNKNLIQLVELLLYELSKPQFIQYVPLLLYASQNFLSIQGYSSGSNSIIIGFKNSLNSIVTAINKKKKTLIDNFKKIEINLLDKAVEKIFPGIWELIFIEDERSICNIKLNTEKYYRHNIRYLSISSDVDSWVSINDSFLPKNKENIYNIYYYQIDNNIEDWFGHNKIVEEIEHNSVSELIEEFISNKGPYIKGKVIHLLPKCSHIEINQQEGKNVYKVCNKCIQLQKDYLVNIN